VPKEPKSVTTLLVENARVSKYFAILKDKHRPPSKGGNTQARHLHVITIDGLTYSFLAAGARKWVFSSDTVSFEWQWDASGQYRNIIPETMKTIDKNGNVVSRGNFDWKPLRTADARMPASRREQRD
jgi:hypothetical protein